MEKAKRGRPRGRPKAKSKPSNIKGLKLGRRNKIESDEENESPEEVAEVTQTVQFDEDCDISALEPPTFTTLDKAPCGPMLHLQWDHPVDLIGEKVVSPRIHICDLCNKPILIYGRMIPCKHVFCLTCAKAEDRSCSRCGDRVSRVEQTGLGTVFMCTYAINEATCKRTYLSQRDLQAHIAHRHVKSTREESIEVNHRDPRGDTRTARHDPRGPSSGDPRVGNETSYRQFTQPPPATEAPHHIPVMTSSRANLITVPLQETEFTSSPLAPSYPPPLGPPFSTPPPIVTYATSTYTKMPQYNYTTPAHPPPFIPPTPVPPPTTFSVMPGQYDPQYAWTTPPLQAPPHARGPPPTHHPPPQQPFYR